MPNTTRGLPYPAATDPVAGGAAAIQALATAVDRLLIQSGVRDGLSAGPTTIAFPIAFATVPVVVVSNKDAADFNPSVSAVTVNGFNLTHNQGGTRNITWMAQGT